jgi:hypothetical protein
MLAFVVWANPAPNLSEALEPEPHMTLLREDLKLASDPAFRREARDSARTAIGEGYDLSRPLRQAIGGSGVAVEPWEITAAWAYDLDWEPLPVIQDYAVYTPALDRLNATALAGDGPATILRRTLRGPEASVVHNVDDRYPAWDGPAAKLALLCNYREAAVGGEWQVLRKSADRCGPDGKLETVTVNSGDRIEVPSAPGRGEIVFARIQGLGPSLTEKLETLAYRRPGAWVSFDGGGRWNMAATTAGDGLILTAPASVDYRRPFQLAPNPRSFRVGIDGAGSRPLTVSFYSRRVRPQRAATFRPPRATTAKR